MTRSWVLALALLAGCGRDSLSPAQRQEVRAIIAEDRAEQARTAEGERQRLLEKHVSSSVDRVAQENHLSAEQKEKLLVVVRLNEEKVREASAQFMGAANNADLDATQGIYREVQDWRLAELSARFGEDTGRHLNQDPFWMTAWEKALPPPR